MKNILQSPEFVSYLDWDKQYELVKEKVINEKDGQFCTNLNCGHFLINILKETAHKFVLKDFENFLNETRKKKDHEEVNLEIINISGEELIKVSSISKRTIKRSIHYIISFENMILKNFKISDLEKIPNITITDFLINSSIYNRYSKIKSLILKKFPKIQFMELFNNIIVIGNQEEISNLNEIFILMADTNPSALFNILFRYKMDISFDSQHLRDLSFVFGNNNLINLQNYIELNLNIKLNIKGHKFNIQFWAEVYDETFPNLGLLSIIYILDEIIRIFNRCRFLKISFFTTELKDNLDFSLDKDFIKLEKFFSNVLKLSYLKDHIIEPFNPSKRIEEYLIFRKNKPIFTSSVISPSVEKITTKPYVPFSRVIERSIEKPVIGRIERPVEKPVERPIERPVIGRIERPVIGRIERPVEKPVERPVERPIEKPVIGRIEKPVIGRIERPVIERIERPIERPVIERVEGGRDKKSSVNSFRELVNALFPENIEPPEKRVRLSPRELEIEKMIKESGYTISAYEITPDGLERLDGIPMKLSKDPRFVYMIVPENVEEIKQKILPYRIKDPRLETIKETNGWGETLKNSSTNISVRKRTIDDRPVESRIDYPPPTSALTAWLDKKRKEEK